MSYTTPSSFSPKRFSKGGYSDDGAQRRPAKNDYHNHRLAPNVKSGKTQSPDRSLRPTDYYHASSLSPSSGTLLERIGGLVRDVDEVAESSPRSDRIDEECSWDSELRSSTPPHFYTPEPREVEEFLESVIDALSAPSHACLGKTLQTRNLPVNQSTDIQTTMNSLPHSPTSLMPDRHHRHHQSSPLGDTVAVVPPASTSTLEECRKRLVPVLVASARTRDPARRLDSEQYLPLLSDDHCQNFIRQAKEMRHQLSSLVKQETPVLDGNWASLNRCPKRNKVDEVDAWVRSTRSRFDSDANMSIASDAATVVSRTDSDVTFVDGAGGATSSKWPANVSPRSQATFSQSNWLACSAGHVGAPAGQALPLVASPVSTITQDHHHPTPGAFELSHQSLNMHSAPVAAVTTQLKTESDTLDVSVRQPAPTAPAEQSLVPSDQAMDIATSPSSTVTDFVSHQPTEPGTWFRQRGTQHKEIVDIDIEVSDEIFYTTKDRQPFRLQKHLRLCSFLIDKGDESEATTTRTATPDASLQEIIGCHAPLQWPRKGKLVLQINPGSERSKTWLPHTLEFDPIDVTSCIRPGKNTFRFIQLSDLSSFSFVLVASMSPREEVEWQSWDWESFIERRPAGHSSVGNTGDNDDDDGHGLSEFARIPVTVRS